MTTWRLKNSLVEKLYLIANYQNPNKNQWFILFNEYFKKIALIQSGNLILITEYIFYPLYIGVNFNKIYNDIYSNRLSNRL